MFQPRLCENKFVCLKEVRKAKGITQAEVASRMGFTVARYSDIENNRKKPSILLALKLARALECNISEIYRLSD
ncbi:MAG: helix-turn-helix transcriptional regulator [Firmicutes bacterium]|nr:helix-turn-helix transcriptional regulator [Bacillota bacterium]